MQRPIDLPGAVAALADARAIAGGTNILDLMMGGVERWPCLLDINRLPGLDAIEAQPDGSVRIGALVRNSDLAYEPAVRNGYAMLSQAILAGASAQLRNMATVGGNLMQRTRCPYFVDLASACNKRTPNSGCDALEGVNRMHAVLGTGPKCIAAHPSDMAVAMVALDAVVHIAGPGGTREVPVNDFHVQPDDHPAHETVLQPQELITAVSLPRPPVTVSGYLKVRDRTSYAFALVSAAAGITLDGSGRIAAIRVAFGGIGTKPWRGWEAEAVLLGQIPSPDLFRAAADAVLAGAQPREGNRFKLELTRRVVTHALTGLVERAKEQQP